MNELDGLLKQEKVVQLSMRIISVLTFAAGIVIIEMRGTIGLLVFFVGFMIMTIIAFWGQRVQKQANEMYQNGFLKNALVGILPQHDYVKKMETPDVNDFR